LGLLKERVLAIRLSHGKEQLMIEWGWQLSLKGPLVKSAVLSLLVAAGIFGAPLFCGNPLLAFPLEESELGRLAKGEVVVRVETSPRPGHERVQAAILIDGPAEPIWKMINDCRQTTEFIVGLKGCRVLKQDGTGELIEHRMQISRLLPEVKYIFRAEYQPYRRIDFKRRSGDLEAFEGSWVLEIMDREKPQTLVTYSLFLDAGALLPQWAARMILKQDLPEILLALRKRVSSLSPGSVEIIPSVTTGPPILPSR
jgi:ribosome-associated toxin RatA of RatAB toxin-antitoxin module